MTTITERTSRSSATPRASAAAYPHETVWTSATLVESYLDQIRDAMPMHQRQIDVMTHLVATRRAGVTRFLDLGCGDGILSAALLQRYPAAQGVLADLSEQMLGIARAKLQPDAARLTLLQLDLGERAWHAAVAPHGPFDVVVSGYAIHHLHDHDKRRVYRRVYDLLTPGGLFINIEYVSAATPWGQDLFVDYMVDQVCAARQRQGQGAPREQIAGMLNALLYTPDDRPVPVEQQCTWLRELGFAGVDCFFKLFGFAVFGGQRPAS